MEKLVEEASKQKRKSKLNIIQKVRKLAEIPPNWTETTGDPSAEDVKNSQIIAGTPFLWSSPDHAETVEIIFVDEAGQLSLIDTLALSQAAGSLVLLGDPQQLTQPSNASHPEGTGVSALEHVLQQKKTISPEQGVFLEETWRMHPCISNYISELFYDSRLKSKEGNELQTLKGSTRYGTPGIYIEPVNHEGNQSSSPEEVQMVVEITGELLNSNLSFVDRNGNSKKLDEQWIKIIAPYIAQVNDLAEALNGRFQIGTVDKFQGQQAPVIICSLATSLPEDAPRGMEFLYSLNRLNVAVSRAKAVFILVTSPDLFEPDCRSPHQMRLANALCRLKEVAMQAIPDDNG